MKAFRYFALIVLLFMPGISANGYSPTADEIVREMDAHRLISASFEMTIRVKNYINNRLEGSTMMKGYIKDGQMTSLTFLEPLNMKDRKIVIKDSDMWLIIPNVKNPIRITASQRLVGGISYGDVAGVSYAQGYTAKLKAEEEIVGMNPDGDTSDTSQCFVLELSTKDRGLNYNNIIIWVDKQHFLPVKADFFALSGKKMTTVYYTAPQELDGKIIITKMFLFDQINTAKHFSMEYSDIKTAQSIESFSLQN